MGELADRALAFATICHKGQVRKWGEKGAPYIVHPTRVAEAAMKEGMRDGAVAAAYLHDVIEDCGVTFETLKDNFGDDVAMLVDELTSASKKMDPKTLGTMNRDQRKKYDRDHIAEVSVTAKILKCLDRADNLNSLQGGVDMSNDFLIKYLLESVLLCAVLRATMTKRGERFVHKLEDAIIAVPFPIGNLSFRRTNEDQYREFECPKCHCTHMANSKTRRYRDTDSVLCEACRRYAQREPSRRSERSAVMALLDRESRIQAEEDRLINLDKRDRLGLGLEESIREARAARRKELLEKHFIKLP